MIKDTVGIILANDKADAMHSLTNHRTIASVPFGGRYRLIDFVLSNFVNSGVKNVGVITRNDYYSLMDHLGSGKEWDLNRKKGGLTILPPSVGDSRRASMDSGKLEALKGVIEYMRKNGSKYVLISDANIVASIDYTELLEYHIEKHAYLTVAYQSGVFDQTRFSNHTFLNIDDSGRVRDVAINQGIQLYSNMLLGTYIIERELLDFLICQCAAHNKMDFERDIIQNMADDLDIYGYCFDGFVEQIDSIAGFFSANMKLLLPTVRQELFGGKNNIITKVRDEVASYYGENSAVENSLIADGCLIEGSVINSIISRSVRIERGATVKNSIIMQDSIVEAGSMLEYCIADKNVIVTEGRTIVGAPSYPTVIAKGSKI